MYTAQRAPNIAVCKNHCQAFFYGICGKNKMYHIFRALQQLTFVVEAKSYLKPVYLLKKK